MKFKKGKSGNPKGKPKGSKNKTTEELRSIIQAFVEKNISKLQVDFDKLTPDKRLIYLEKFLSHVLPRPLDELSRLPEDQLNTIIERLREKINNQ